MRWFCNLVGGKGDHVFPLSAFHKTCLIRYRYVSLSFLKMTFEVILISQLILSLPCPKSIPDIIAAFSSLGPPICMWCFQEKSDRESVADKRDDCHFMHWPLSWKLSLGKAASPGLSGGSEDIGCLCYLSEAVSLGRSFFPLVSLCLCLQLYRKVLHPPVPSVVFQPLTTWGRGESSRLCGEGRGVERNAEREHQQNSEELLAI